MDLNDLFSNPDACDAADLMIRDLPMLIEEQIETGVSTISITLTSHTAVHLSAVIQAGIYCEDREIRVQEALDEASAALTQVLQERQRRSFLGRITDRLFTSEPRRSSP